MPPAPVLPPLPAVVVGGWLGAGKTTLVNALLRRAGGRRIAVLVNDFGSVNIDADLIEGAAAGVLALSGGCLCCAFGDDLLGTLAAVAARDPRPDAVLVELSGVALPAAVLRTLGLSGAVEATGALVLADATAVRRQAQDRYVGDTVRQQLQQADWLLPSKTDLLAVAGEADDVERWLQAQAPQARLLPGPAEGLPVELLLGWGEGPHPNPLPHLKAKPSASRAGEGGMARPLSRGAGEGRGEGGARTLRPLGPAASRFESLALPLPDGCDLQALGARLAEPQSGVLRAKGLARTADGQGRLLQVAAGRVSVTPVAVNGPGRLLLIGLRGQLRPAALLR
ncbi:MAG: CobW family GTP-binding protein [Rubrivivax sp.]